MKISRRAALKLVSIGSGTLFFPLDTRSALADTSPQLGKFQQPLRLPNLLKPVHSDRTYDYKDDYYSNNRGATLWYHDHTDSTMIHTKKI